MGADERAENGSKPLLATYLQTLLAYPDGCTRGETVFDAAKGTILVQVPPLSEEKLHSQEHALADLVAAERMGERRVLVYATHTGTQNIAERMDDMLTQHGFRVAVMNAEAVAPERREAWVAIKVKQGIDVLICHPGWCRLASTRSTSRPSCDTRPITPSTSCGRRPAARGASSRSAR